MPPHVLGLLLDALVCCHVHFTDGSVEWKNKQTNKKRDDLSRCLVLDTESHSLCYFVHIKTKEVHYFVDKYVQLVSCQKWALLSGFTLLLEARGLLEHYLPEDRYHDSGSSSARLEYCNLVWVLL